HDRPASDHPAAALDERGPAGGDPARWSSRRRGTAAVARGADRAGAAVGTTTSGGLVSEYDASAWAPVSEETRQLADAYGVATEYWDQSGNHVEVGAATVAAVLTALGVDVSTPESIAAALVDVRLREWRRMLPPVFVTRAGQ